MSEPWRTIFMLAVGGWLGALAFGILSLRRLLRRRPLDVAWPAARVIIPVIDLIGVWVGSAAVLALWLGRRGYTLAWALAMGLLAVMLAASLYDRAVLMPSMDAAYKRLGHGDWEADWRFLWRMSGVIRALTAAMAVGCLMVA